MSPTASQDDGALDNDLFYHLKFIHIDPDINISDKSFSIFSSLLHNNLIS